MSMGEQKKCERASGLILGKTLSQAVRKPFGFAPVCTPGSGKRKRGKIIRYKGEGHIITFGKTGSGKTSSVVMCNALMHPGSMCILDVKGEIYDVTARRRREMGQKVYAVDMREKPRGEDSLNPIDMFARCGSEIAVTARTVASNLINRANEREPFWNDSAENLITAGCAWAMADCPRAQRRLGRLLDLFTDGDVAMTLANMMDSGKVKNPAARKAFAAFLGLSQRETMPSVLGTAVQHLRLFDTQLIRRLTDRTTIDLEGFIKGEPMTIYIIVPPHLITQYSAIIRLWFAGLVNLLMQRREVPRYRTLLMCDETAALGRMDAFVTAATLLRSWGVTFWSFWQNPSRLEIYGHDARTIMDNAGVLQFLRPSNLRAAAEFADLMGGVTADEIMAMPDDELLLLTDGVGPTRHGLVRYFEDSIFDGLYDPNRMLPPTRH